MPALTCPRCRHAQRSAVERCPRCGADLTALLRIVGRADTAYDAAVRAARSGDWAEAGEQASVALALVPDDVDALVLLAKTTARQGRRARSVHLWERVGELAPERTDAPVALAALRAPVPPADRMRALVPPLAHVRAAVPTRTELVELARTVRQRLLSSR